MKLSSIQYARVSRIALLTFGSVCFLCGIGLAPMLPLSIGWMCVAVMCCAGIYKRRLIVAVPAVAIAGIICGMCRGGYMHAELAGYQTFLQQKVQVEGIVAEDTTYDSDDHQQVLLLNDVNINSKTLPGSVRVKSLSPVEPRRGDRVHVAGKLYGGFGNYQAALYFADMTIIAEVHNPIDVVRREFAARLYSLLPDTQAGLGLGFLLGIKSSVPDGLNDQLKLLGLTHIVVASGYNLTVLVRVARRLFASVSHFATTAASLALICGFVMVTGFSPSMSRAALVAGLSVWAWYYGRRVHPALLITLVAALTAAINPLYVWGDLGWWLSFLAFAGVMLLAPLIQRRIFRSKEPKLIGQMVLETISAEIMTLPLIILVFGSLSVLSLVANVLVVPLIPLAMLLVCIAGVVGWIVPFVAWPAIWLLTYMCSLVQLLAGIPWASVPFKITVPIMVASYMAVGIGGFVLYKRLRYDYLGSDVLK